MFFKNKVSEEKTSPIKEKEEKMKRMVWFLDLVKVVVFVSALLLLLVDKYISTMFLLLLAVVLDAVILGIFIGGKERRRKINILLVFIEILSFALAIRFYLTSYSINGIGLIWLFPYFLRMAVSEYEPKKEN